MWNLLQFNGQFFDVAAGWVDSCLVAQVTVVFHQYETGIREGTIYPKVKFTNIQ